MLRVPDSAQKSESSVKVAGPATKRAFRPKISPRRAAAMSNTANTSVGVNDPLDPRKNSRASPVELMTTHHSQP